MTTTVTMTMSMLTAMTLTKMRLRPRTSSHPTQFLHGRLSAGGAGTLWTTRALIKPSENPPRGPGGPQAGGAVTECSGKQLSTNHFASSVISLRVISPSSLWWGTEKPSTADRSVPPILLQLSTGRRESGLPQPR